MKKKKVLIFGMTSIVGGIETFLMNMYENIDFTNIQVDFLVLGRFEGEYREKIEQRNSTIYEVEKIKKHPIKGYKQLKRIFEKNQYDVIHMNLCNAFFSLYILPFMFNNKRTKIICHSHNGSDKRKILHYLTKGILNHFCTEFIACSDKAAEWMFTKTKRRQKEVLMINNAIDTQKFLYNEEIRKKIRKKYNIGNEFVVGHVGRFEGQKNHTFLIDMFSNICRKEKNVKLLLVGTGSLVNEIKQKVRKLQLEDKVIFCGVCSNINELYQAMDLFVLPSIFEGLPVSGIEAQASGLKCLFSNTISKECDITENITFLPINNSEIWAEELIKIIKNGYKRENMQEKIKKANYDMKTEVKKIEKLYLG